MIQFHISNTLFIGRAVLLYPLFSYVYYTNTYRAPYQSRDELEALHDGNCVALFSASKKAHCAKVVSYNSEYMQIQAG